MARTETYTCDVCGAVKGEVNHWWRIRIVDSFHLYAWDTEVPEPYPDEVIYHLCGQQCVIAKVNEFMSRK